MGELSLEGIAQLAAREVPFPPDDIQRGLVRSLLWPLRDVLEADLLRLRAEFDRRFLQQHPHLSKDFPIGFCREISAGVLALLRQEIKAPASAGVAALRHFCIAGGTVKMVWGSLRQSYFQNAFQVGDLYVDVANDSVVRTKPKVEILPFDQADFRAVVDYSEYAQLALTYWRARVYPNRYMPQFAPLYPLLLVYPSGQIKLHSPYETLFFQNLLSNHRLAEQVICDSSLSEQSLPPTDFARLQRQLIRLPRITAEVTADLRDIFSRARASQLRFDVGRCQGMIDLALAFNATASETVV